MSEYFNRLTRASDAQERLGLLTSLRWPIAITDANLAFSKVAVASQELGVTANLLRLSAEISANLEQDLSQGGDFTYANLECCIGDVASVVLAVLDSTCTEDEVDDLAPWLELAMLYLCQTALELAHDSLYSQLIEGEGPTSLKEV